MHAVAETLWGDRSLAGRHVVVSGVGKVGSALVGHLVDNSCRVTAADIRADTVSALVDERGVSSVDPATAHAVECDIFSPCALGAVLTEQTIPELACSAVCGSANNQLGVERDGDRLAAREVLYAPDYVANAGGVINIADELGPGGYARERAWARVAGIEATMRAVFELAEEQRTTTAEAADLLAERRLAAATPRQVPGS
jgi:leucine dehydrogenase